MCDQPSSLRDRFLVERLPPPGRRLAKPRDLPELHLPDRLNAAATLLAQATRVAGSGLACRDECTELSVDALTRMATGIAARMIADHGIIPGNRVVLAAPNSCALIAALLGTLLAGAVAVPLMPLLRAGEIAAMLGRLRPHLALGAGPVLGETAEAARQSGIDLPVLPLADLLAPAFASPGFEPVDTAEGDPALVLFTSGTTGRPKAVVHSHGDILAIERSFGRHVFRAAPGDVVGGSPSLAFAYGFGALLVFPLGAGAAVHLLEGGKPRELARTPGLTMLATAPTGWRKLLAEPDIAALPGLRRCFSAGEPLPDELAEAWRRRSGLDIIDMLGSTEMLGPYAATCEGERAPGVLGRAVPGYRLAVLDRRGRPLAPGRPGRLAVQGPSGGSFLDAGDQARFCRHGWLVTGDRARIDSEGRVSLEGRADDILVCAGYNISAPEVEAVLARHAAVADCALTAVRDAAGARHLLALVVPAAAHKRPGLAARLLDHLRAELAIFKLPREIRLVADLPRTASGKLRRKALAARYGREQR